jgi:uncharacterized protein DUF1353
MGGPGITAARLDVHPKDVRAHMPATSDGRGFQTRLREVVDGRLYRLTAPLIYEAKDGRIYEVETGFLHNGMSSPWWAWWLFRPFGHQYDPAIRLHDKVYRDAEAFAGDDHGHISRGAADDLLIEAMESCHAPAAAQQTIYVAVRLGGWRGWRTYRRQAVTA